MSPTALLRSLTPLGWLTVILVGVAIVSVLLGGLGFRWDPLDLARRRADRAEAAADLARSEAATRAAEAEGQTGQVARLDAAHAITRRTQAATTPILLEARTAHDAELPLSSDRLDRLRAHDDELCRIAPDLGGCPAAPDPARDGRPAL
ncbi:hypothetical protein IP78_01250 [Brevundimonas sp. AAP58]|uniref:hypothetical protein n=1 Tax=Brevundimonas sp. AAP58 TaxID=1523422 RepID=UPI0006B9F136|nr:hypothetical protein [Brevundimonas sp. AAP58]KPF83790.1 hypothetical protein IP78_01250 [Brevundimonas sp. AAP58]